MKVYDQQMSATEILEESVVSKNRDLMDKIKNLTEANATWGKKIKEYSDKNTELQNEVSKLKNDL